MPAKQKMTREQRRAYKNARVDSYTKRSVQTLAEMLVELEDATDFLPEFSYAEWREGKH